MSSINKAANTDRYRNWSLAILLTLGVLTVGFVTLLQTGVVRDSLLAQTSSFSNYPTLQANEGLTDPSLAYGLEGVVDWTVQMPFLDLVKTSRSWIGHIEGQWGGYDEADLHSGGHLGKNGWPTSIPSDVSRVELLWDWSGSEYGAAESRAGDYVLFYEGTGTFVLNGVQNEQRVNGQVTFSLTGGNLWSLGISATDAQDPLRNFVIVKEEYLPLYEAGAIFNPDWIELVDDARQVRFMDWMHINNSTEDTWSERTEPEDYTWTSGVPVEIMVRLANEIGADPWFNIPFHADDNYSQQYATYVRDNLDPDLIATVEYSNEVWNWAFEQAQDAGQLAEQEFGQTGGAGWVNYYGKRASEVMAIWTNVFGSETSARLNRTAAVHTGWPELTVQILEAPMWETADPANYVAPHTYFDSIAGTTYFGGSAVSDEDVRTDLFAAINDSGVNAYDWHEALLRGNNATHPGQGIPSTVSGWEQLRLYADEFNIDLIAYEGGQHVHHAAFIDIPQSELDQLQDHMVGFIRSQQMADLYQTLWTEWALISDGPFMQFVDLGRPSQWGSWGARASLVDNPPRALLLDQLNVSTPAWWENRGGSRFQQGVTEIAATINATLVGSNKIDFLAGNASNNILYGGPDNDYLNGGAGEDTALFTGDRSAYTVNRDGDAYLVTGPDGQDRIINIEILQFADQAVTPEGVAVDGPAPAPTPDPTPSVSLTADPTTITNGDATTLTWSSSNASSCSASGSWSGSQAVSGTASVSPSSNATYTLTCTGDGGTDTVSVNVVVETAVTDPQPSAGARAASPFDVAQVHSGHSLTDAAVFQGDWPGHYQAMINAQQSGAADVWKSTIPGSPMSWRRENVSSPSGEDAWTNIASRELLVITENNLVAPASLYPSGWEADMRQERRDEFTTWVTRAAAIGNGGAGAEVIFYTNWPAHGDYAPASNWRARLAANEVEWMAVADQAVASVSGVEEIYIVPGNELVMQLWDDAEAGRIPGISDGVAFHASTRWWSDDVHPAGLGNLALGYLTLGVVHQVDPRTVSATGWGLNPAATAAEATYIQNLVWDILNSYERTGFTGGGSTPEPSPDPEPTLNFSADTTSITAGESLTLTWSTENANSCTASNGWSGSRSTGGTESQSQTSNTTYTLTCIGDGGEVSDDLAVVVAAAPEPEPDPEPVNQAPVAVNDTYSTDAGVVINSANVLTNDTDPENDSLTLVAVSDSESRVGTRQAGSNGGAFLFTNNGSLTFDPDGDYADLLVGESRQTSITYTVADSSDARDTGVVTVTVNGTAVPNRAPVASDDSYTTDADTVLNGVSVLTNDTDADGDVLTVFSVDGSSSVVGNVRAGSNGGNFIINSDGSLAFDPADDFQTLALDQDEVTSIDYVVRDEENVAANATVRVTVSGTQPVTPSGPPGRNYEFKNKTEEEADNPRAGNGKHKLMVDAAEQCDVTKFTIPDTEMYQVDENRDYPMGMYETEVTCIETGKTITQEIMLDQRYDTTDWELRKYYAASDSYTTINPAVVTYSTRRGVTVVSYQVTDGGVLDSDGEVNGVIVDPVGIAIPAEPEEEETNSSGSSSSGSAGGSSSSGGGSSSGSSGGSASAGQSSATNDAVGPVAPTSMPPHPDRWNDFTFKNNISFIRKQDNKSTDVRRLQEFLNAFENEALGVDGTYDEEDLEAVRRFQEKHRREVLDIWNLQTATGFVGITTRLKMNAMLQGETTQCPLFTEYNGGQNGVMSSPEIGETQQLLRDLDMYNGPISDRWDTATNQALIIFQETFRETMLDPWNISSGTGYKYKTTNKFLNYLVGCTTEAVYLEGVGTYGAY